MDKIFVTGAIELNQVLHFEMIAEMNEHAILKLDGLMNNISDESHSDLIGKKMFLICEEDFGKDSSVLELIDSWFNTDDKIKMSNKLEVIAQIKKLQGSYMKRTRETLAKLKKGSNTYLKDQGFALDLAYALPMGKEKKENLDLSNWAVTKPVVSKNLLNYFDENEKKKREIEEEKKKILNKELNAQTDVIKHVNDCLKEVGDWVNSNNTSVYSVDEDSDSNLVYIDDMIPFWSADVAVL